MTRKDFRMIAAAIADAKSEAERGLSARRAVRNIADYIADGCAQNNEFFDRDRFIAACGFNA